MPSPSLPNRKSLGSIDGLLTLTPNTNNGAATNRVRVGSSGSNVVYSPSAHDDDASASTADSDNYLILEGGSGEEVAGVVDALAPGENVVDGAGGGHFDLCGSMWKRRGGLGRNADRNWVMRCFTLYGPILCYHEESNIESVADPSKPRARLNLSKTETIAEMHSKHKPGLPTENLLTINIYDPIVHSKRKWEMCCTSKEQQLKWYRAINMYDGAPVAGRFAAVPEGGGDPSDNNLGDTSPRYNVRYSNDMPLQTPSRAAVGALMDDVDLIAKAAAKAAEMLEEKQSREKDALSWYQLTLALAVLNVAIYFVRNGSEQTYRMTLFFANAFALYVAMQHVAPKEGKPRRGPKARAAKKKKKAPVDGHASPAPGAMIQQKSFAKTLPAGKTIPRAPAVVESELEATLQTHGPDSAEAVRAYAAAPTGAVEIQPHSYASTDATGFNLRVGPNYKKNKQKAPSGPALYDLVSMDFLYSDTPLKNTADKFRIPHIPGVTDVSTGHSHIPPVIVVNTWLPAEEPAMFAKNTEGETYNIPLIFALSKDTLEQLKDLATASPGVQLLSEWCKRAENEEAFRGRFKCMGYIENIENSGVPKFIQGYNGKPALVTKSGTFTRHPNYIEFTINVNMWAFLARKGLYTLTPTFPEFLLNIGFTIEAREDEEMPEVLLGGVRVLNLDPEKAVIDGVDDAEI